MSAERIELSTNSLKGYCSAIELRAPRVLILTCTSISVNELVDETLVNGGCALFVAGLFALARET